MSPNPTPNEENMPAVSLSPSDWVIIVLALRLSPREAQIMKEMLSGKTERAIAEALDLSTHTVHTHIMRLYRKLNVKARSAALARIISVLASNKRS